MDFIETEKMAPISENIGLLASEALAELENIQQSGAFDFSTESLSDLKKWISESAGTPDNDVLKDAMQENGMWPEDEKTTSIEKSNDVVEMLDQLITKPELYKVQYPDKLQKLINICRSISENIDRN